MLPVFLGLFYSSVAAQGYSCFTVWIRCLWGPLWRRHQPSVTHVTHQHSLCADALFSSKNPVESFQLLFRESTPLRVNLLEGWLLVKGDTATTNTESWVHLRLSQVLDGMQGFCTPASGSKPWGSVHPEVKELTTPLISSDSVRHGVSFDL